MNYLMHGDCLERMKEIPDGCIDMVLCDPPYGTTQCRWDSIIDLGLMWKQLKRVTKTNGAIVMTAAQPFTSVLVSSNLKMFKYDWCWQKPKGTGHLNAKRQQSSGFEYFQWIDSDDERVRDRHEDIANRVTAYGKGIYRWDNPPLSDRGTPIIPGQDFQCRCIARPVLTSEVEANQAAGRVRPGVRR